MERRKEKVFSFSAVYRWQVFMKTEKALVSLLCNVLSVIDWTDFPLFYFHSALNLQVSRTAVPSWMILTLGHMLLFNASIVSIVVKTLHLLFFWFHFSPKSQGYFGWNQPIQRAHKNNIEFTMNIMWFVKVSILLKVFLILLQKQTSMYSMVNACEVRIF